MLKLCSRSECFYTNFNTRSYCVLCYRMTISVARLCLMAALLILPLSNAADILSTHPPFAKCDPAISAGLKLKNSIFPIQNLYETVSTTKIFEKTLFV